MILTAITALTGLMLLEKLAPFGARSTWLSGGVLAALALWILAR
jgi:predicted metal-binding membrane protein